MFKAMLLCRGPTAAPQAVAAAASSDAMQALCDPEVRRNPLHLDATLCVGGWNHMCRGATSCFQPVTVIHVSRRLAARRCSKCSAAWHVRMPASVVPQLVASTAWGARLRACAALTHSVIGGAP